MTSPTPPEVSDALDCLFGLTNCTCHEAFTSRDMQDPECQCDYREDVATIRAHIATLEAELAAAAEDISEYQANLDAEVTARLAAEARLAEAGRDAERYRWLREGDNDERVLRYADGSPVPVEDPDNTSPVFMLRLEKLDAAIDAALPTSGG
jgi:hypothetical protein